MRFLKSIDIVRSDFLLWYTFEHSQLIDQLESRQYPNRVLRHWLFSFHGVTYQLGPLSFSIFFFISFVHKRAESCLSFIHQTLFFL